MNTIRSDVYNALVNDGTYISCMSGPTSVPYQTFFIRPPKLPSFPETVFHFGSSIFNKEHGRTIIGSSIPLIFSIWSKDDACETIAKRIIFLLHQTEHANGWKAALANQSNQEYDEEFDVFGMRLIFDVHYRSNT